MPRKEISLSEAFASRAEQGDSSGARVLVWDLPTRLYHWLLAAAFAVALVTGDSDRYRDLHVFAGYLMLALVGFRVLWGIAGTRYARFASFPFAPRSALDYLRTLLRGTAARFIGHNPAGSVAIYLMWGLAIAVCASGVAALGSEEGHGALRRLADNPLGEAMKETHEALAWLLALLAAIHVGGVAVESLLHRENLAWSMISGKKRGAPAQGIASRRRWVGVALVAATLGWAGWFFQGRVMEARGKAPQLPFVGKALPGSKIWKSECGGCHLAFHPTLLPARSWAALLAGQDRHFGEALGLEEAALRELAAFANAYPAESGLSEPAYKINKSVPAGATPLRITETPYWIEKHARVPAATWRMASVRSKANCAACHLDAEQGTFEDAAMRLPRPERRN